MSHGVLERAEKFAGGKINVQNLWGKAPLLAIIDDTLSDFSFRVLALFAVPTLRGGAVILSHAEIAEVLSCSSRQARRATHELEWHGLIAVSRSHNCRNAYKIKAVTLRKKVALAPCLQCKRVCKPSNTTGWCKRCTGDVELEGKVRRLVLKYSEVAS